jgi:dimethylargininase
VTLYGVPRSRAAFAADPRHPNTSKGNVDQQPRVRAQHRYATLQSARCHPHRESFLAALVFGAASISPVSHAPAKIAHVLTAITRAVSPALAQCELTFVERQPVDLAKAQQQHTAYERLLAKLGIHVHSMAAEPELPDSMFVEDPAIVLDELAVILPLGTKSRQPEAESLAKALAPFRKLAYIAAPAAIEGGDVLRIDRTLYVGQTTRTNAEGVRQLAAILGPHNYRVVPVPVTGCLHLKSAVTYLGGNTLLANRLWFDNAPFANFQWIEVDPTEPHAANALAIADTVIFPASFPKTRARIEAAGFLVTPLDISELQKAESGLTCSSLIFTT